ncbi:septal ring lytic transglycosylase RlpA family protein [Dyella psychrodurans]|uniref:Endolytic peptidoglycan transglycosylase RlpA n=1 Tax=Dyella psychrodurans TaxID=1927960 RepID=A0A370WUU1_9GAMM|nr:septal ring lytic transglycosylase RlpA family protein [Dyella psychrodurans]RDS79777.1 septal ring lytic transglycosylase RlpA family protein [Dyella psychrodurans]
MRAAWRLPWLLATALVLVGCGGHRSTRPSSSGYSSSSAPGGSSGGGFHDDTSRPQSSRYRDGADSIPDGPPPDLSTIPEPVPKTESRSLYGNKSPYTVLGRTYTVLPTARGYDERGIASFYGSKFHGYKTSNLEDYDMYKFTAASKVLPLPSYARVTNLENGKSVIVRINDRGPFHEDRVIDLSYAAAVKIGVWPKGTGLVEVQGIDPSAPPSEETPPPPVVTATPEHPPGIYLQVGAFADPANAEHVAAQLRVANFAPVQVVDATIGGRLVHRVRVGPLADVDSADRVTSEIEQMGLPHPQVAVD